MSENFGAGSGLVSLILFLLYQFLSHRKKKASVPSIPQTSVPLPEPHRSPVPVKIRTEPKAAALPQLAPAPQVKNPVYIPKKTHRRFYLKSKREMIILSEIYKNPYLQ